MPPEIKLYFPLTDAFQYDKNQIERLAAEAKGDIAKFQEAFLKRFNVAARLMTESEIQTDRHLATKAKIAINQ